MTDSKTCFVITPYGDPDGTPQQQVLAQNISALIENIIRPVGDYCASKGFDVRMEIGFDEKQDSDLWGKIGRRIEAAETVLAVIASEGPNAYLELGLAYGLWMRPILLCYGGWELPSDISSLEYVQVSYDQAFGRNGANPQPVIENIGERLISVIETGRRRPPDLFDKRMTSYGLIRTMSRFNAISNTEWSAMLNDAAEHIVLVLPKARTVLKQKFQAPDGEPESLTSLLTRQVVYDGVDVTIVTNHPDMVTPEYLKRTGDTDINEFRDDLKRSFVRWNTVRLAIENQLRTMDRTGLEKAPGKFRFIQAAGNQLPYRITLTESRMLLTLRFTEESYNSHHCMDAAIVPSSH
ncbi:MAG: hypothetical protein RID59_02130, partial [Hoeflea sp.]